MPALFLELFESSLSRVHQAAEKYDVALMSAWRVRDDIPSSSDKKPTYPETSLCACDGIATGTERRYSDADKAERNRRLKAALLSSGYGVTAVKGAWIDKFGSQDAREVEENSYLIVNLRDSASFVNVIEQLGQFFCQNSVLIKLRGQPGYLLGTNKDEWPGLGKKAEDKFSVFRAGWDKEPHGSVAGVPRAGPFYSKVGSRPFAFTPVPDLKLETILSYPNNAKYLINKEGEQVLRDAGLLL